MEPSSFVATTGTWELVQTLVQMVQRKPWYGQSFQDIAEGRHFTWSPSFTKNVFSDLAKVQGGNQITISRHNASLCNLIPSCRNISNKNLQTTMISISKRHELICHQIGKLQNTNPKVWNKSNSSTVANNGHNLLVMLYNSNRATPATATTTKQYGTVNYQGESAAVSHFSEPLAGTIDIALVFSDDFEWLAIHHQITS